MTRFEHYRRELQLSQQQVASLMHISRRTYGKYERGQAAPTQRFLMEFSRALHIPPESLGAGGSSLHQPVMPVSPEEEEVLLLYRRLDSSGKSFILRTLAAEDTLCREHPELMTEEDR